MAGLTTLTHISQILHISFNLYCVLAIGICIFIVLFWLPSFKNWVEKIDIHDTKAFLLLLGLGITSSIISLIVNRPNADDYYYIPNAIFYMQNPNELMGFKIHYLFNNNDPFESFAWATSSVYEYIQAIISLGLHIRFIDAYYLIMPAFVGFLVPMALYLAIVHFSDNTLPAIIGTFVTVGVILLLGETPRTFGSFSLVRIYQGKAILLSLGIPLFTAFSINYLSKPSYKTWIGLLFVSTGLMGLSSSAIFILPALSCVLLPAYMISAKQYKITTIAGYFISLGYVILVAFYVFIFWKMGLNNSSPANLGWPTTFLGHANFFVNSKTPLTPILMIGSTIVAAFLLKGMQRLFILTWALASIVLFLNPLSSTFLIEYITSANAYWRMFYIYPFPIIVGVISVNLFTKINHMFPRKHAFIIFVTSIIIAGFVLLSPSSVFYHNIIAWPTYKLPSQEFKQAIEIVKITPPGVMLAPEPLAGIIVMIDSKFPQIRVRSDAERTWIHSIDDANLRIAASDYIGGSSTDFSSFQTIVNSQKDIHSIVIKNDVLNNNPEIISFLNSYKFINQRTFNEYTVLWK